MDISKIIFYFVGQLGFEWNTLLPYLGKVEGVLINFINISLPEEDLAKSFI